MVDRYDWLSAGPSGDACSTASTQQRRQPQLMLPLPQTPFGARQE